MNNTSMLSHLLELRRRLLHTVLILLLIFAGCALFANDLYEWVALPLIATLPSEGTLIATQVTAPFFAPLKLAFVTALFIGMPVLLYQFWAFIAPGLYRREKRLIAPLLLSSSLLFYGGVAFVYWVVFPLVFGFFNSIQLNHVTIATDINSYLDFVLSLFFAFGFAFEIPIAIILLCWTGITSPTNLANKRPYVIVGAFVIGMLLTPPDVISQTLLAIPMWFLFEVGLLIARFYSPKTDSEPENTND